MARDPQQTFYYHNKVVLRSLVIATSAFFLVSVFFWWRSLTAIDTPPAAPLTVVHFSDEVSVSYVAQQYGSGARYIHDIERYPEIRSRFFGEASLDFSSSLALETELGSIKAAVQGVEDWKRQHVYATSYYIGNTLVLPGVTLYEQLLKDRPQTTALLEAALADVRAGVVKISSVYDVAPPYFYDTALAGALYYQTPSSPSLTVSEVATVLYLLAEIDPVRARLYEQQLADYAEQVLAVGAHFPSDIQSALDLVSIYHRIIIAHPEYARLIEQAQREWPGLPSESAVQRDPITERRFTIRDFPYQTAFFVDRIINQSYVPRAPQETSTGALFLTLEDIRIPDAKPRLYTYRLTTDRVLPVALDLSPRQYPFLLETFERASYHAENDYYFLSGNSTYSRLIHREQGTISAVGGLENRGRFINLESRPDYNLVVLTEESTTTKAKTKVQVLEIQDDMATILHTITDAMQPTIVDKDTVLFVDTLGSVQAARLSDRQSVEVLPPAGVSTLAQSRSIKYFSENSLLLVIDRMVNPVTLVPETEIALYAVEVAPALRAQLKYSVAFVDTKITSGELSPGGRYLAVTASTALGGQESKILLFDIMNGIIIKEIDISDFATATAMLDGWIII